MYIQTLLHRLPLKYLKVLRSLALKRMKSYRYWWNPFNISQNNWESCSFGDWLNWYGICLLLPYRLLASESINSHEINRTFTRKAPKWTPISDSKFLSNFPSAKNSFLSHQLLSFPPIQIFTTWIANERHQFRKYMWHIRIWISPTSTSEWMSKNQKQSEATKFLYI